MDETITQATQEIKNASEEDLKKVMEDWYEKTRTAGMKVGALYISAAINGIIQKHTNKKAKVSLNDYRRCITDIVKVIEVQLTPQNDSTTEDDNDDSRED